MPKQTTSARLLYYLVVVAGMVLLGLSIEVQLQAIKAAWPGGIWPVLTSVKWMILIPANAAVGLYRIRLPRRNEMLSAGDVLLFVVAMYFGPAQACIVAALEGLVASWRQQGNRWRPALYNSAALAITYHIAGTVFHGIAGQSILLENFFSVEMLSGLAAMVVGKYLINAALILAITLLSSPVTARARTLVQSLPVLRWMAATELVGGILSLFVMALTEVGLSLEVSLLSILLVCGYTVVVLTHYFSQYDMEVKQSEDSRRDADLAEARAQIAEARVTWTLQTVKALASAIEAKDPSTLGHVQRVAAYVEVLSVHLRLTLQEVEAVRIAALLHDVGKLGISDLILSKTGPLSPREREKLESHVEIGAQIVSHLTMPSGSSTDGSPPIIIAEIIRHHHERYDGIGYPMRLAGEDIPYLARLLGTLDSYDLAIYPRNRPALSSTDPRTGSGDALSEFRKEAGGSLDPNLVALVIQHHQELQQAVSSLVPSQTVEDLHGEAIQDFASIIARSQREGQRLLDSAHHLVGTSLRIADVLETLTRHIEQVVPWATIMAFLSDQRSDTLEVKRVDGLHRSVPLERRGVRVYPGSPLWRSFERSESLVHEPAKGDLQTFSSELADCLEICNVFPLTADRSLGVVAVYHPSDRRLSSDEIRFLESLTGLASPALQNACDHHSEATTDELTGLINYRYLMREGSRLLQAHPDGRVAVMMIDLDGFKAVNDRFGHEVGDQVLQAVTTAIRPLVRHSEMLARKGGDEFVMILVDVDEPLAFDRGTEIARAISNAIVTLPSGDIARVGASLGIAVMEPNATLQTLLRIADGRMYRQKRQRHGEIREQPFSIDGEIPVAAVASRRTSKVRDSLPFAAS